MLSRTGRTFLIGALAAAALLIAATVANADHSWNNYHWGRTANPFTLQVVDSVTSDWDATVAAVSGDWSLADPLDLTVVAGDDSQRVRKSCKPVSGKIRACNAKYGFNGWIGLATIWISGGHIVQGTSKVNESYFALSAYNEPGKKRSVLCQEIGHDLGLDHNNDGAQGGEPDDTCMNDKWYLSPNQHDYDQLAAIYAHTDDVNTYSTSLAASGGGPGNAPAGSDDALPPGAGPQQGSVFVRDLGGGRVTITYVTWVGPGAAGGQ